MRRLVVIGASAGGLEALRPLLARIKRSFSAPILVVVHIAPNAESRLAEILGRSCALPVRVAVHDATLEPGTVTVAVPDHHLLINGDRIRLTRGPRENHARPAIDPLFRSAARWHGSKVIGVVLSGVLDDGTSGLAAIKLAGGLTMAQDPREALFPGMPASATASVKVDVVASAVGLADALNEAIDAADSGEGVRMIDPETPEEQGDALDMARADANKDEAQGPASSFTCPDCHGALWELREGELTRYRCRVGHAFSPDALFAGQSESVDDALWMAYRSLEEAANIARRLAERAETRGFSSLVERYRERATEAVERGAVIRQLIERGQIAAENAE